MVQAPFHRACNETARSHAGDAIRRHNKACGDLGETVDRALGEMPDDFSIKEFLVRNRAEVKGMVISEWNQERYMQKIANVNMRKGRNEEKREIAANLLKSGIPVQTVATCCGLSEDEVRSLEEGMLVQA